MKEPNFPAWVHTGHATGRADQGRVVHTGQSDGGVNVTVQQMAWTPDALTHLSLSMRCKCCRFRSRAAVHISSSMASPGPCVDCTLPSTLACNPLLATTR